MNEQVKLYIEKYPLEVVDMFLSLRRLIYDNISVDLTETLWAKLPSYYAGDSYVRLIPFKDHINIEAKAITEHVQQLAHYKITPKGMLQLFVGQAIPTETLQQIFKETLS